MQSSSPQNAPRQLSTLFGKSLNYLVILLGTGLAHPLTAQVTVAPSSLSWAKVSVGQAGGPKVVTLTNRGSAPLPIRGITFGGASSSDFAIFHQNCTSSLAASSACTVTVLFTPKASGTLSGTLNFAYGTAGATQTASLSGLGIAVVGSVVPAAAAIYYVSNCGTVGSDANSGKSSSTPWNSIAKVNGFTFHPGDTIKFNDGCTWREQLVVPSAGTAGEPITVATYGSGSAPVINGAEVESGWMAEPQTGTNLTTDRTLQAYWDMEQMTGTSFLDGTANGNVLSSSDGVRQSDLHAQGEYSASFSGVSGQSLSRSNAALSAAFPGKSGTSNQNLTIGGWVYFNTVVPATVFLSKGSGAVLALFLGTGANANKMEWQTTLDANYRLVASNDTIAPGSWYHVVGRVSSATHTQQLFLNGVLQAGEYTAHSTLLPTDSTPFEVGDAPASVPLNGYVDELFVFDRALSDSEIAGIYNAGLDGSRGQYDLYYRPASTTPVAVYEDGAAMTQATLKAGLTQGSWWWDSVDSRIYIRPTGDREPSSETIEIPVRDTCITDSRSYTVLSGITCEKAAQKGVLTTGDNVVVENMLVEHLRSNQGNNNGYGAGIYWEGSSNTIQGNTVTDANWGIFSNIVSGKISTANLVQSNTVYNIGYDGIGFAVASSNAGVLSNSVAQYNVVHDIGLWGSEGGGLECIFGGKTLGTGNAFRYNTVYHNGSPSLHSYPLNVQGGAGKCSFYGNIVYNNYGPCVEIAGGPGGNFIYNNTCYNNGLGGEEGAGFFLAGGAANTGNAFKNNIVYASAGSSVMDVTAGSEAGNSFDYNLYYGGTSQPFTWNGSAYSMATYQNTSGQGFHSLNADPGFTDAATAQFAPLAYSPALSAGENLGSGYENDLGIGSAWPNTVITASQSPEGPWDIGAYVVTGRW